MHAREQRIGDVANSVSALMQASARARIPQGIDMSVNILTSGYWPTYPILDAVLPEELSRSQVTPCLRPAPASAVLAVLMRCV